MGLPRIEVWALRGTEYSSWTTEGSVSLSYVALLHGWRAKLGSEIVDCSDATSKVRDPFSFYLAASLTELPETDADDASLSSSKN